jgi:hypothetical protein
MQSIIKYFGANPIYSLINSILSFFNYFGIIMLIATSYDSIHHLDGGPTTTLSFIIGPFLSILIVSISIFIISSLRKKNYQKIIGVYVILHFLITIVFVIGLVYVYITTDFASNNR